MGSGLIYAAIIGMWALYFIPRWLRRHEELSESRSVEKFDHAMRILSRKPPTPDQRYVVMPRRPSASGERKDSHSMRAGRPTRGSIAVRRRRVLALLVVLAVTITAAVPVTLVPWWSLLGLLALFAGFVVHLRVQERRRRAVTRTRDKARTRSRSRMRRLDSAARLDEARKALALRRAAAEAERVEAEWAAHEEARRRAAVTGEWEPMPVPLPTYVTKPMAPRTARPIDLTTPGRWSDARVAADGTEVAGQPEPFDQSDDDDGASWNVTGTAAGAEAGTTPASAATYDDFTEELDTILERRRAVGD